MQFPVILSDTQSIASTISELGTEIWNRFQAEWFAQDDQVTGSTVVRAWALLLGLCFVGFLVTFVYSFLRRLIAGSGIRALFLRGCYEWIPGRGIHLILNGILWVHFVGWIFALLAAGIRCLAQFDDSKTPDWKLSIIWLSISLLGLLISGAIHRKYSACFIHVAPPALPKVNVSVSSIGNFRDVGDTSQIGTERFPNDASAFFTLGVFTRQLLRLVGITAILLQIFVAVNLESSEEKTKASLLTLQEWQAEVRVPYCQWIEEVRAWNLPKSASLLCGYFAFTLLIILLYNNKHYLLVRFRTAVVLVYGLATALWILVTGLGPIGEHNYSIPFGTTLILTWLVTARWHTDLRLVSQMKRKKRFLMPVSELIGSAVSTFLPRIQNDPDCRLPEMDADELSERITRGASNLEEGDPFVTRFFGRFMRIAKVAAERCTSASVRFMTINRYTQLGKYWPTFPSFRDPQVPVWDEALFPIRAPEGFINWTDSLRLSKDWNPVYYCPITETRQETYYENETYWDSSSNSSRTRSVSKTRTIEVTCSKCGGSGALEYARFLVTTWKTNRPTIVEPAMSMPELVENAEEVYYYQKPLIEAGSRVAETERASAADPGLVRQMESSGQLISEKLQWMCEKVRQYTDDAYVYRSDYIIGGFYSMNIRFAFLGSRSGWFFGRRPEFHFGRLPIGWATVTSWLFLPPIALTMWGITASAMLYLVATIIKTSTS